MLGFKRDAISHAIANLGNAIANLGNPITTGDNAITTGCNAIPWRRMPQNAVTGGVNATAGAVLRAGHCHS
jgi:hypothetical protein